MRIDKALDGRYTDREVKKVYDYILFDFDGTVYDTVEGITRSVQYALRQHGMDAPLESLRCFAGPPLLEMFMERFGVEEELAKALTADFRVRYRPIGVYESRVFPGVKELLLHLRAAGKKTAVATSKPQRLAEELLARENMTGLFDFICGAGDNGEGNAKWQVVERAMEGLDADRSKTILVGDTRYDVSGAHRCGIPCVGVEYGYAIPGDMESSGADAMVRDTMELEAFLLSE